LDGDFFGAFPTGDGSPGGDCVIGCEDSPELPLVALPGDSNLDGRVSLTDLSALAAHYGQSGVGWVEGDFDASGHVSLVDLSALAAHYGQTVPPPMTPLQSNATATLSATSISQPSPSASALSVFTDALAADAALASPAPRAPREAPINTRVESRSNQRTREDIQRRRQLDAVYHGLGMSTFGSHGRNERPMAIQQLTQPYHDEHAEDWPRIEAASGDLEPSCCERLGTDDLAIALS
jgi:hypothetical protein